MNPILNDRLIVPKHNNRIESDCILFDLKTYKIFTIKAGSIKKELIDTINSYKGTLLFVHNKYNVYGVIRDSGKVKPNLYWLRKEDLDANKDYILNYTERFGIIDISDEDINIFRGKYRGDVFQAVKRYGSSFFVTDSEDKFIESIIETNNRRPALMGGSSNINSEFDIVNKNTNNNESTIEESKPTNIVDDNVKQSINDIEKSESKQQNSSEDISNKALEALQNATESMNSMAEKLKETADKYSDTIARSQGELGTEVEERLVQVDSLVESLDTSDDATGNNIGENVYSVYDVLLKLVKIDDSISIPRVYYEKLITLIKRNIILSMDGTKYDSIVQIKFSREVKENIIARVEYDESKDFVRVHIIKPYNATELSSNQIIDYEIKYNQWKKQHSFRITD